jgi:putative ABC transport system substrate-binding protein
LAPGTKRVALLLNSRHYGFQSELAATERTGQALGLATEVFDARAPDEFPRAFQGMTASKVQGVVVFPDALMTRMAPSIAEFSIRERIPVVAGWASIARAGVLASYGPDLTQAYERVGHQVASILRGANASEMPIEQPTRIFTVINLKTARALGLAVPQALLFRADEVIR